MHGAAKLTKNADPDKYSHGDHGVGFDMQIEYTLPDGSVGKNVIMFGADMNSSVHIDNKGKDILIFCKVPTQGLNNTTLTAETQHSISFTRPGIKFCLSLNFIMLQNYISSKQKTVK